MLVLQSWQLNLSARLHMGDIAALKEIGDRLDGKPTQEVEQTSVVMTYEEKLKHIADDLGIRETDSAAVPEQLH